MIQTKILNQKKSILNRFMAEIRDQEIQKDPLRFRENIKRISQILALEISKTFDYKEQIIKTPLAQMPILLEDEDIVIATILRAGIPMQSAFLEIFDKAQCAFITAHRIEKPSGEIALDLGQIATPSIEGKTLLIVDPMLATGISTAISYKALVEKAGEPKKVHFACILGTPQGVEQIKKALPEDRSTIWAAAIDPALNSQSYIVPGLGDAGDLMYGEKL
ncbi:MAG: uracil phosphoribosyltransferase [Rikenellaceae bacterium]